MYRKDMTRVNDEFEVDFEKDGRRDLSKPHNSDFDNQMAIQIATKDFSRSTREEPYHPNSKAWNVSYWQDNRSTLEHL